MTSFLFWNVMNKDLRRVIARAVAEHLVDVLLLAEAGASDEEIIVELKTATNRDYASLSDTADKIRIFTSMQASKWIRRQSDNVMARMGIWSVDVGRPPGILLAAVHFVSKNNTSVEGQALLAVELSKEIGRVEKSIGHKRTLVIGDLNMNPFEPGMTGANALHAVMTKQLAAKKDRIVQGSAYGFFYNPMWGFFGDRTIGPPGTYYHSAPSIVDPFWHILDHVLLRPDLMNLLEDLAILDRIEGNSLLTISGGTPQASQYSDHLPLFFRLQLN